MELIKNGYVVHTCATPTPPPPENCWGPTTLFGLNMKNGLKNRDPQKNFGIHKNLGHILGYFCSLAPLPITSVLPYLPGTRTVLKGYNPVGLPNCQLFGYNSARHQYLTLTTKQTNPMPVPNKFQNSVWVPNCSPQFGMGTELNPTIRYGYRIVPF